METDRNNIRIGRAVTTLTTPSHTRGVREGNEPGGYKAQGGHLEDGRSTARRSTGINADKRNPIDERSPNLSPA
ncbi:MAG TPA: hypothetical protein VFW98_01220 [Gemmatimonadaceae bacterium]|nr:hypothetical protein [Gemmatimonadaceae bacterium]